MKCPKCVKLGLKSTITPRHGARACPAVMTFRMDYYDEEGKYHNHTPPNSWDYDEYHCSNKHNFTILGATSCWCGWKSGEDKITILDDDKQLPESKDGTLFTIGVGYAIAHGKVLDVDCGFTIKNDDDVYSKI